MQTKNRKGEYRYVRYVLLSYALSPGMVCGAYQNPHVLNLTLVREPSERRPGFFVPKFVRDPIGKEKLLWIGMWSHSTCRCLKKRRG